MRVLLTGAHGFIGAYVAAALRAAGHMVVACVRTPRGAEELACDLARDLETSTWLPRLAGIDAVVNCAGILRETGIQTFAAIHVGAPLALFRACAEVGVRRVVQLSALGEPEDGEFVASKHRADAALAALDLEWTVLRPGLVYSASGCYGGTALLRSLAVLPGALFLPQRGAQRLRPVAAEDVGAAVVAALACPRAARQVIELTGPQTMCFVDYLRAWRAWFGLPRAFELRMPRPFVTATVGLGETLTRGPLCRVIWNLLQHERVGAGDTAQRLAATLQLSPRSLATALAERPCRAADLQAARLHSLVPALRVAFALLWLGSGIVGLLTTDLAVAATLPAWPLSFATTLARCAGLADCVLGALLLFNVRTRLVTALMLAMLLAYTIAIGVFAAQHWLDPFGGLLKNIVLIVALMLLRALAARA
ncbi:MAG: SDR family oxidoreductase [Rudaea sp.]